MDKSVSPRVLLTGATGYIGGRLLRGLVSDRCSCAAIVRPQADTGRLAAISSAVEIIRHNGSMLALLGAVQAFAPDVLVHLAAISRADHRPEDVRSLLDANIVFGTEVLEAASAAGCRGVVATGTFWEHWHGRADYEPNSLYAATKRAFADIVAFYSGAKGLGAVTLELTDVYGPDDPRKRLLDLLRQAQETGTALDLSPGEQELDLIHVDDVVEAYLVAAQLVLAQRRNIGSRTVATGRLLTLRQVVQLFEDVSGGKVPVRWGARPYRSSEVMRPWPGERLDGWRARLALEDGIRQLISPRSLASGAA